MHDKSSDSDFVVISRDTRGETVNGKPRPKRVYITGPHFNTDIYSSTEDKAQASRYTRAEANELLVAQGKWQNHMPAVEADSRGADVPSGR